MASVVVVGASGTLGKLLVARLSAQAVELRTPNATDDAPIPELARASVVVNVAGPRVRPSLDWEDYFREHVGTTLRVVRSMPAGAHLVHISATAVYGARGATLATDAMPAPTMFPSQAYACAKLAAETAARAAALDRKIRVSVLRPSMIYGPGVDSALESIRRLASRGIALRFTPKTSRQHLLHVDLFAEAVARATITTPPRDDRLLVLADPFVLTNEDLRPARGVPFVVPLGAAEAARSALSRVGVEPLALEALAVLAVDNVFDWEPAFDELALDRERFARETTFDAYWNAITPS